MGKQIYQNAAKRPIASMEELQWLTAQVGKCFNRTTIRLVLLLFLLFIYLLIYRGKRNCWRKSSARQCGSGLDQSLFTCAKELTKTLICRYYPADGDTTQSLTDCSGMNKNICLVLFLWNIKAKPNVILLLLPPNAQIKWSL